MLERLFATLIVSKNAAADDLLLEALRVGNEHEKSLALDTLIRREQPAGLSGVIAQYADLPPNVQLKILEHIKPFHHALRECGRSESTELRLSAMKLVALGRQGKLAYVLAENLHESDEAISKAAADALVALARWVASETRKFHAGQPPLEYQDVIENRSDIEAAVARALDIHRGKLGAELMRAALLLADWAGSKTLAVLHTARHGGQSPMIRRLQQSPASEHVEAFLLGASHGGLRSHFAVAFSHIDEAPVLDGLLRQTHWLKDHSLQICVHGVSRGSWWDQAELARDIDRRTPEDAAKIADWIAASGIDPGMQDERLAQLRARAANDLPARLRLLRIAAARPRGSSTTLIKSFLTDPDERLVRMATRELVRRKAADVDSTLLKMMPAASESVRRVIGRSIGQAGFDQFWLRFDRMDRPTRRQAGRAMLKILPDATQRLSRKLTAGPADQRVKALQVVHELGLGAAMHQSIVPLCMHPSPKVRSKAVAVIAEIGSTPPTQVLEKVLNDSDARVRANAIEVLETMKSSDFLPLLSQRMQSTDSRERANAIKAVHNLKVGTIGPQLLAMLRDDRPEHRVSAIWTLQKCGIWQLINEIGRIAKEDVNQRVRRYAFGTLRSIAQTAAAARKEKAA